MTFSPGLNPARCAPAPWFKAWLLFFACSTAAFAQPTDIFSESMFSPTAPFGLEKPKWELMQPSQTNKDLADALQLVGQGDLDAALAKAEGFLKLNSNSAPGEEVVGLVLVMQGKIDEGLAHLQRAIEINPLQSTAVTKVGDVYLARHDLAKAKAQFQQAVALNPGDRFAHQRLGMIFEQEMDYPQAVDHFEKGLIGSPPDYVGVKVNLGRLYNLAHQYRKTVDLLTPVVTESYPDATAHLVLGTAWLLLHDPRQALVYFERAKKVETRPEAGQLALGIAYREAGDLEKSQQELEAALKVKPDWSAAEYQMGETLAAANQLKEAMAFYTRVATREPASRVAMQNHMAEVYARHGERDEAIKLYQALRTDGSADVRAYAGLATVLQASDRLPEAEAALREADQRYPENAQVQYSLGMHLALTRDYDRAIKSLRHAHELAPADPRIQKAISLTEFRRNDIRTAIVEAQRLLALVPDSYEDQFYLATLQEQVGQDGEAEKLYEGVLRHSADHVGALNNLAQVRLREKQPQAALELAQKAARLAPENPSVLDTLGWVQYSCGNLHEAAATLEKAVANGAGNPGHRYHLAVLYSQLGRKTNALEQLDLALKPETGFPDRGDALRLAGQLRKSATP
jgi:tetratricopeptide (TPR) repeat protein